MQSKCFGCIYIRMAGTVRHVRVGRGVVAVPVGRASVRPVVPVAADTRRARHIISLFSGANRPPTPVISGGKKGGHGTSRACWTGRRSSSRRTGQRSTRCPSSRRHAPRTSRIADNSNNRCSKWLSLRQPRPASVPMGIGCRFRAFSHIHQFAEF